MKRGKDDEKVMGPMFPRLHVNDTEKRGPRAPPRNKMALYEQLSIPSQRFSRTEMTPVNHNNNTNFVPPASSSSLGNEHEMGTICRVQVPPSRHPAEKPSSHYLVTSAPSAHLGQKKKSDEDDLRVPIFVLSKGGQVPGKYYDNVNREKLSAFGPTHSNYSIKHQIAADEDPKQIGTIGKSVKQNAKGMVGSRKVDEAVSYSQSMTEARDPVKLADMSFSFEPRDDSSYNYGRLQKTGSTLQPKQRTDSQQGCGQGHLLSILFTDRNHEDSSMSTKNFEPEERNRVNDTESREDRRCQSLQTNNGDQEDDASETSMVDSECGVDISPDDVVGIMGQKCFWKARRAIVNQQRVFAVQVFELHRLIKVQKLIAKSSHLLEEDNACLGRPIKVSSVKKLPLEYIGKASSNVSEHKSEKPYNKMEFSAENTVGKASQSSVQNGGQPISYGPFAGNTPLTSTESDPNVGPWGFNQPQGHQWLVPVMSPSEGLVYKPYPGPGFTSPVCGGCGPPGSTPLMSNFLPSAYGVPTPHHQYQVMGVPTFVPSIGPHGYFPPYGMQVMNPAMSGHAVEQISQFNAQGLQRQLSGGGANFSVQHQNSCDLPGQKSGAEGHTLNLNVRKDNELQGSTASSPTERAGDGSDNTTDRSNPLPLFPSSPVTEVPSGSPGHHEGDQTARVIRVVPHNGRSATESAAARIFRSIQEERKQYDSV